MTRWWFGDAPAERLAALRILIGAYALAYVALRLPEFAAVARLPVTQFQPIGVVRVLVGPLPPWLVVAIAIATCAALCAFVAGWAWRVSAPIAAALLLWTLSYRNSWGIVFHTEDLLVLHVIALACTPAADAWAIARRRTDGSYGWGIKLLATLTVATYVLAGIAKLRLSGAAWLDGEQLRNHIAVDNLRKALAGDATAPLALPLLSHPAWFTVVSIATLVVELGAPLALHPRVTKWWVIAAWGFHLGVILMMNIWFPYPLFGVAFLPLLPAERVIGVPREWIRRRFGRVRDDSDLPTKLQP